MLLDSVVTGDGHLRSQALDVAKKRGLVSMGQFWRNTKGKYDDIPVGDIATFV